jgi:serine/threonine protein kinase/tetratricopeptide (TPR) repeat protein
VSQEHCPGRAELRRFLGGELPETEARLLESHFATCPLCAERAAALEAEDNLLSTQEEDFLHSPVIERLMGRLEALSSFAHRETRTRNQQEPGTVRPLPSGQTPLPDGSSLPEVPGYELLQELGRGGMGVVYKARHIKLNRLVALKMILAGEHAGADHLARFQAEAQAAARLRHPNIVAVYEVGQAGGRPFLSMEFCPDGSLATRLREGPLPPREAALLIQQVALAVHAAHKEQVVHRDLKPANILMVRDGEGQGESALVPKVSDFGLAKRLDVSDGQTQSGDLLGTPSYMAPEQAEGRLHEIGPTTDVYALGAIIYELLTGRPPFKGSSVRETLELVCQVDPVPPRQLQPRVPRDLETICLKCLHKEPKNRYASAAELADDLRRFREGRTIQARPFQRSERLWRWSRRNPGVAGLSAALGLTLIIALVVVTLLWRQAEQQRVAAVAAGAHARELAAEAQRQQVAAEKQSRRALAEADRASQEAARANRTAQVLAEMFEAADPLGLNGIPALKPRASENLSVVEILDRGAARVLKDLAQEPATQAKLLDTIGNVYCTLGLTKKARPLLLKALALREKTLPADHPDLATSLHSLAWLNHQTGDYAKAERLYRRALAIRRKRAEADPLSLSATLFNLGWLLSDLSDLEGAEAMFKEALAVRLRRLGPDHRDVAVARAGLVAVYVLQQNYLKALSHYQRAMATLRKIEGSKGLIEAIDLFQRGLLARELPDAREELGLNKDESAEDCLKRSRDLALKVVGNRHYFVALVTYELASTLQRQGKMEEAEAAYRDCLRIGRVFGLDHPKVILLLDSFCPFLVQRGKRPEAERLLAEALQARRRREVPDPAAIADILVLQAELLSGQDSSLRRKQLLLQALEHYCKAAGNPRGNLFECLDRLGDCLKAPELFRAACDIARVATRRERTGERDRYLKLAMTMLWRARKKGFRDVRRLREERDLDGLRGRADFRKLLRELEDGSK